MAQDIPPVPEDGSDDTWVEEEVSDEYSTLLTENSLLEDVDPALTQGKYKWHVRAKNGRNFGRWTAYRTITITIK